MKTARTIMMVGCLGFLLVSSAGADGDGNARTKPFGYSIAGTNITTTIDTNGDGVPAGSLSAEGRSTLGPISVRVVNESVLDLQDPQDPSSIVFCALPDGGPGLQFEQILGTSVFQVRGKDLLTAELVEGTSCLALATCFDDLGQLQPGCVGSVSNRFQFTGGTGKFAGASGSFEQEAIIEFLVVSPTGNFNTFVAEGEGEIHVPRHRSEEAD